MEDQYANVEHEGESIGQYTIENENGYKFITISTWHLSEFKLTFTNEKEKTSSGGSSGSSYGRGRWYMEARQGDLIIGANGENLSPDLIEQRLALQAGTASCVLGMELEGDERPVLIVQTAADDYARASAAAYEAVARLPLTMRPARIFLTEQELPISFGKPRRALVQELCELLGSVTGQTVGPDTQLLQELGVDSLTYYNIFSAVSERYGISLTMDAAHPLFTARDFAAAVQAEREAVE